MQAMDDSTSQPQTKQCSKCKQIYPATLEYFFRDKSRKSGFVHACKGCCKAYAQQYRENNQEKIAEYRRQYYEANPEYNRQYHEANREKAHERSQLYRKNNQEKVAELQRRYYEANREKVLAYQRQYFEANREKVLSRSRQYQKANPQIYKAARHRRRALKCGAEGTHLPFDEKAQLKRQKSRCYYCQCKLTEYHVEHIVPLSRGGSDHPDNKVLACPSCNLSKRDRLPSEWSKGGRLL